MRFTHAISAALLAASLLLLPSLLSADDETPAAKPATADKPTDKGTEKAPPADATTQGTVDVGGRRIAYTAVAGTITVGSTDVQDAQLGPDGKPQPGSQLALSEPKEPKDATPVARMSYVAYFKGVPGDGASPLGQKKDAKSEDRPVTFFYNGGPGSSTVWSPTCSSAPPTRASPMNSPRRACHPPWPKPWTGRRSSPTWRSCRP